MGPGRQLAQEQPEVPLEESEAAAVVVDDPAGDGIVVEGAGEDGGEAVELVGFRLADRGGLVGALTRGQSWRVSFRCVLTGGIVLSGGAVVIMDSGMFVSPCHALGLGA
jgi:hypothetical protein